MTAQLILVALGPVQDFIAQARRTRDLWFGSHLLSELSRACAAGLAEAGAELIFPAFAHDAAELQPCNEPVRPSGEPPVSVANKILAEWRGQTDPADVVRAARKRTFDRWTGIAATVRASDRVRGLVARGADDAWHEQVQAVLEFYAAWVPLGPDYGVARDAVERRLAARKSLRDFEPYHAHIDKAPKSSLDGGRVSVLARDRSPEASQRLRLSSTEELDAIGVIKRAGFDPDQFVPLLNIAAGSWLARAACEARNEFDALTQACRSAGVPRVVRKIPVAEPFPFDASVLYPSRWPSFFEETGIDGADRSRVERCSRALLRAVHDGPPAYVACLVADGDNMGKAINALPNAASNRNFSKALAGFPAQAARIVQESHRGALVFAGGDDVLAFVPVSEAVACAEQLAIAFQAALKPVTDSDLTPTLSVGLGIGHALESMSDLLHLGRDAERLAKGTERNALGIIVDKRSGGRMPLRLSWAANPAGRIAEDIALLRDRLSAGKLYGLGSLCARIGRIDGTALLSYAAETLVHGAAKEKAVRLEEIGIAAGTAPNEASAVLGAAVQRLLAVRAMYAEARA